MLPIMDSWSQGKQTLIHERFHMGGVGSVRGFALKGIGPKDKRLPSRIAPADVAASKSGGADPAAELGQARMHDALGGDVFASIRAGVRCPFLCGRSLCLSASSVPLCLVSASQPMSHPR